MMTIKEDRIKGGWSSFVLELTGFRVIEELGSSRDFSFYRVQRIEDRLSMIAKTTGSYEGAHRIAAFQAEYNLLLEREGQGVLRPYGLELSDDRPVLLLEDPGGVTWEHVLRTRRQTLKLPELFRASIALTDCLRLIHQANLVLNEMMPLYLLIQEDLSEVKCLDLQSSSLETGGSAVPPSWERAEDTLPYLAPEQSGRMGIKPDYRSDFYTLGSILYEWFAGSVPFQADHALDLVYHHLATAPESVHVRNKSIPMMASAIVHKCLEKMPQARYVSAYGIRSDLEECLAQLRVSGKVQQFPLATRDVSDRWLLSDGLIGRREEQEVLLQSLRRASEGAVEIVWITGQEGIGKTSLVQETLRHAAAIRVFFAADQPDSSLKVQPHPVGVQVLEALTDYLLTLSRIRLEVWKEQILEAIQGCGQLLVKMVPRLSLVLGDQPDLEPLPPRETQMRMDLVMSRFIQLFPQADEPLILFFDDMHGADEASLEFLTHLLADRKTKHLLFIGAYRQWGSSDVSPFQQLAAQAGKRGSRMERLHLAPYGKAEIQHLLGAMLQETADGSGDLVDVLVQKTAGNPLYLQQFLQKVFQHKLVVLDEGERVWKWDNVRVAALDIPENRMAGLLRGLHDLPDDMLDLLGQAACIGKLFDVHVLSRITDVALQSALETLGHAVKERLLQPKGTLAREYLFQHDQIQQAVYARIPRPERVRLHMKIGWDLATHLGQDGETDVFQVLHHLNQSVESIQIERRHLELAELNVRAGQQAKQAMAFETALVYLQLAAELLDEDSWQSMYALTFQAYREKAETEFLCGRMGDAAKTFGILMKEAASDLDRARICLIKIKLEMNQGRHQEVMNHGIEALRLLGFNFDAKPSAASLAVRWTRFQWKLRKYKVEEFGALPPMTDERLREAMTVLVYVSSASFIVDKSVWLGAVLLMLEVAMDDGLIPELSVGMAGYALLLTYKFHRYEEAYKWGSLAREMAGPYPGLYVQVHAAFTLCHESWGKFEPDFLLGYGDQAVQTALRAGDLWFANHSMLVHCKYRLDYSHPLKDIYAQLLAHTDLFRRNKENVQWKLAACTAEMVAALTGVRAADDPFADIDLTAPSFAQDDSGEPIPFLQQTVLAYHYTIDYLLGDYEKAYAALEQSLLLQKLNTNQELLSLSDDYYYVLIVKEMYDSGTPKQKAEYVRNIRLRYRRISQAARRSPEHMLHKSYLVRAVLARLQGKSELAGSLYEQALEQARQRGFIHDAGIIAECFAKFALQAGKERQARFYMLEAYSFFQQWEAQVKVTDLENRYGHLLNVSPSKGNRLEQIDYHAVVLTAQVLSGEMEMDRLLRMLMQIMLHHAGAEYGALIFHAENRWTVEAHGTAAHPKIASLPLEEAGDLVPASILDYTARTREVLVLQNASGSLMFQRDDYVRIRKLKSALCLPILYQSQLIGLLYMENNLSTDVFTSGRLDVLKLLSSQSAISITNARLYSDIQFLKSSLEDQVLERTLALEKSMKATSEALAEITVYAERNRIAQEIHDIVGHTLTSTVLQIEAGKRLMAKDSESALTRLKEAQDLVRHSLSEIRNSVHMLKQDQYYELEEAMRLLLRNTEHNTGTVIHARIDPLSQLTPIQKKVIYHALQEGLTNGIRHGQCTEFRFSLLDKGAFLEFRLSDNGKGAEELVMGFGLKMMKDRVEQLKGSLYLDAQPNKGCLLRIQLPLGQGDRSMEA